MSTIDLMLDEENEITFKVNIEGTQPGTASCRLVVENGDMDLLFNASNVTNDEITVTIPPLKHVLSEGKRNLNLEVVVDDKLFVPLTVQGNFEKRLKITAEAVTTRKKPKIAATASIVSSKVKSSTKKSQNVINEKARTTKRKKRVTDQEIMNIIKALTSKKG